MSKRVVIIGGGESGKGTAILAASKGFDVFLSDFGGLKEEHRNVLLQNDIDFEEKQHTESKILNADIVVKSPGVPEKAPIMKQIREKGIPVMSEIAFAAQFTTAKLIGITGTNGKTTTTHLVQHILETAGKKSIMAGNVGNSFAYEVATNTVQPEYYVLEISSFQLDDIGDCRFHTAILLNITPDHLDRYNYEMQNYIDAKFKITKNQTNDDVFIYCEDDEVILENIQQYDIKSKKYSFSILNKSNQTGYLEEGKLKVNINNSISDMYIDELALQGKHNLFNSMAAAIMGRVEEISNEDIREALSNFKNIEHRLEFVARVKGIDFINDSKATNVNAAWYALECMTNPVIWIVGGVDKGNDYSMLEELVAKKVKAIICLGSDNEKIKNYFTGKVHVIEEAKSMEEAVKKAYSLGKKDEVALLSPACASFDMFENYEDRGRQFKMWVREL